MQFQTGSDLRRSSAAESGVGEAHLQHALERDIRAGQERAVLAIHLSKLLAPGPRPHHRRIAKAIMDEAAQSSAGQVFVRANADVVLLCDPAGTARVQDTLARLFRAEALDTEHLLSAWVLPQDSFALEEYLSRTAAATTLLEDPSASLGAIGAMDTLLASVRLTDFSRRQLAVQVTQADMIPLYRELTVSMEVVDARSPVAGAVQADPYLFRHLTSQLDPRMMELLAHGMGRPGLMAHTPMPHLNLSVRAILSPGFLHLAEMAEAASVRLGVEVAMVEACADPLAFGAARMVLRAHGCVVVLDGITHQGLLVSRPGNARPGPGEARLVAAHGSVERPRPPPADGGAAADRRQAAGAAPGGNRRRDGVGRPARHQPLPGPPRGRPARRAPACGLPGGVRLHPGAVPCAGGIHGGLRADRLPQHPPPG